MKWLARQDRLRLWLARHYMVAIWFLIIGALILAVETYIQRQPGRNAASAVILLFGGYEVILDQINKRLMAREHNEMRQKYEAGEVEKAELRRQVEADAQEKAELRRRITELEQRNGNGGAPIAPASKNSLTLRGRARVGVSPPAAFPATRAPSFPPPPRHSRESGNPENPRQKQAS